MRIFHELFCFLLTSSIFSPFFFRFSIHPSSNHFSPLSAIFPVIVATVLYACWCSRIQKRYVSVSSMFEFASIIIRETNIFPKHWSVRTVCECVWAYCAHIVQNMQRISQGSTLISILNCLVAFPKWFFLGYSLVFTFMVWKLGS